MRSPPTRSILGRTLCSHDQNFAKRVPTTCGAWSRNVVSRTSQLCRRSSAAPASAPSVSPTTKGTRPVRAGDLGRERVPCADQGVVRVVEGEHEQPSVGRDPSQLPQRRGDVRAVVEVVEGRGRQHAVEAAVCECEAADIGGDCARDARSLRSSRRDVHADPRRAVEMGEQRAVGLSLLVEVGLQPHAMRFLHPAVDQVEMGATCVSSPPGGERVRLGGDLVPVGALRIVHGPDARRRRRDGIDAGSGGPRASLLAGRSRSRARRNYARAP